MVRSMLRKETIEKLGWFWMAPYGWTHDDEIDIDGCRQFFGTVEDVCKYLNLEEVE
jgi:hypothetical protein